MGFADPKSVFGMGMGGLGEKGSLEKKVKDSAGLFGSSQHTVESL